MLSLSLESSLNFHSMKFVRPSSVNHIIFPNNTPKKATIQLFTNHIGLRKR